VERGGEMDSERERQFGTGVPREGEGAWRRAPRTNRTIVRRGVG
jgi:hypothetical protein